MNIKIYNTQFEVAVRILILLVRCERPLDIEEITTYDYLLLHLGDVNDKIKSLHPDNPFHGIELYSKRNIIQDSITLLVSKGLLLCDYNLNGIAYKPTEIGADFLEYFESSYFHKLKKNADFINSKFIDMKASDIKNYINQNYEEWKDKFEFEALFRGENIE